MNGAIVAARTDTVALANLISMTEINAIKEKGQCRLKITVKNKTHHALFTVLLLNKATDRKSNHYLAQAELKVRPSVL